MFDKSRVMAPAKQLMDGSLAAAPFYEQLTKTLAEEMGRSRARLGYRTAHVLDVYPHGIVKHLMLKTI